jgi:amino acid transporter
VCPSAAFAVGWAYWFLNVITIANELQAVATVLSFWTDKVPTAVWITIFWAVMTLVNVFGVTIFAEVEVICSTIKFSWIIVVIFSMIGMSASSFQGSRMTMIDIWQ